MWLVPCQTLAEPWAPPAKPESWTWEEAARVRADGRRLEGPRRLAVKTSSPALTKPLEGLLREAAALDGKKRDRFIDESIKNAHALDVLQDRLRLFRKLTWRLNVYGNLLLPGLWFGVYGLFFIHGVIDYWPFIVGGYRRCCCSYSSRRGGCTAASIHAFAETGGCCCS